MSSRSKKPVVLWILVLMVLMLTFTGMGAAHASEEILYATEDQQQEARNRDAKESPQKEAPEEEPNQAPTTLDDAKNPQSEPATTSALHGSVEDVHPEPAPAPKPDTTGQEANTQPDATPAAEETVEYPTPKPEPTEVANELVSEDRPTEYTIRFLNADNALFFSVMLSEGDSILEPKTNPSLNGYEFQYWYDVREGEKIPFSLGAPATEDLTIKAFFTQIETSVQVPEEALEDASTETDDEQLVDGDEIPEMIVIEDEQTPLAGPSALDPALCAVHVTSNLGNVVEDGDVITMTGKLIGFDGHDAKLQWQFNDGAGWKNAQNANGLTHSFAANEQTVQYRWRLTVSV